MMLRFVARSAVCLGIPRRLQWSQWLCPPKHHLSATAYSMRCMATRASAFRRAAPDKPSTISAKPQDEEKKKRDSSGDDDGDEVPPGEGEAEAPSAGTAYFSIASRAVVIVIGVSAVFYYFARPSGLNLSWKYVINHAADIESITVYDRYAQIEFRDRGGDATQKNSGISSSDGGLILRGFVGLTGSDAYTHQKIESVKAEWERVSSSSGSGTSPPVVTYVGESWSAMSLRYLSTVILWTFPLCFYPVFALILTRGLSSVFMTAMQRQEAAAASASGSRLTKQKIFKIARRTDVKFADIAGMYEAKKEIVEFVDFLKNPDTFKRLGAKLPTGAMLLGPPGTGKTLLAKAVAGEADVPFIAASGSDFVELYVGMGALRVRQLFELAKKQQRCIIYIDEVDAVGLKRRGAGMGEKQEQEHTLNELLSQLDGFDTHVGRILVLASSNVPIDQLDTALIRPGRFDRIVHVDPPVLVERQDIFRVHLNKLKLMPKVEPEVDPGIPSAADIAAAKYKPAVSEIPPQSGGAVSSSKAVEEMTTPISDDSNCDLPSVDASTAAAAAADAPPAVATVEKLAEDASVAPTTSSSSAEVIDPSAVLIVNQQHQQGGKDDDAPSKPPVASLEETQRKEEILKGMSVRMANLCPGFVGADIASICNEAAILAARERADTVAITHLERSIDRVVAGIEMRSRVLSDQERKGVAYHEAGHAVTAWFCELADPLMKVSVVPRGGKALGYAQFLPNENNLRTSKSLMDSMCVTLGGRASEKLFFDWFSTGAADDLMKVTQMAYHYAASFGDLSVAHVPPGTYLTRYVKPYGSTVSKRLDDAAKALLDAAYKRTYRLLESRRSDVVLLAEHLLHHEVLTYSDVVRFLGERPQRTDDFNLGGTEEVRNDDQNNDRANANANPTAAVAGSSTFPSPYLA